MGVRRNYSRSYRRKYMCKFKGGMTMLARTFIFVGILYATLIILLLQMHDSTVTSSKLQVFASSELLDLKFKPSYECFNPQTQIVILILSMWNQFAQRRAIRDTWAKEMIKNPQFDHVTYLFVTGVGKASSLPLLEEESGKYGDVLVGSFEDNVYLITRKYASFKTIMGVRWTLNHHCSESNLLVVTVNDGCFINLKLLSQKLLPVVGNTTKYDKFWIGNVKTDKRSAPESQDEKSPIFLSKYDLPFEVLPTFCSAETGSVISYGAAKYLYDWSHSHYIVKDLDVYMRQAAQEGHWFIATDKSIIPSYEESDDICSATERTITTNVYRPYLMRKIFKNISNTKLENLKLFSRLCKNPILESVMNVNASNEKMFETHLKIETNPSYICKRQLDINNGNYIFLLMLISSKPEHWKRRVIIRQTWGKDTVIKGHRVQLLFVIAKSSTASENIRVKMEAKEHKDLIIFDFKESHFNLTLKVVGGLKWVTENCNNARFLYKGDDDMFVNLDIIVAHLSNSNNGPNQNAIVKSGSIIPKVYLQRDAIPMKKLYLGSVNTSPVIRNTHSKYYVSFTDYKGKYYPPFASGGGYIISCDVIPAMYKASLSVALINNDDAYQGILAKKVGVKPIPHDGFQLEVEEGKISSICDIRKTSWVVHGFYENRLKKFWHAFVSPSTTCEWY